MMFEPMRHRCPICNSAILCELEVNSENKFERVSEWACSKSHKIEDEELLERLEDDIKAINRAL